MKMPGTHSIAMLERVVEQGNCADVLNQPGHDYTRALLAAVPQLAAR